MNGWRLVSLLFIWLLPAVPVPASDSAASIEAELQRMREAVVRLSYEGTFVYQKGDELEVMHMLHSQRNGRPMSRVTALTGEPRQVVRNGDYLTCIWPDSRSMMREPVRDRDELPLPIPDDPASLEPYYRFVHVGEDRVAGFRCRVLRVEPRDDYRYGYEYCVEPETGMLLRASVRDRHGKVIEQFLFTRISFPDEIPESAFDEAGYRGFRITELPAPQPEEGGMEVRFSSLPPGFSVTSRVLQPGMSEGQPVTQVVLSDGLASVSLFLAPAEHGQKGAGEAEHMRSGAVQALSVRRGNWQVTAVGEVPRRTLEQVLAALEMSES